VIVVKEPDVFSAVWQHPSGRISKHSPIGAPVGACVGAVVVIPRASHFEHTPHHASPLLLEKLRGSVYSVHF
jgi:hypothetical protein